MARKIFGRGAPTDPRLAYWSDELQGSGTIADPLTVNVTGQFFAQYAVQFVHPSGDNSWEGSIERPKKTRAAAHLDLVDGGTMYIADGCAWSDGTEGHGLVAGQGMRISNYSVQPVGWLQDKSFKHFAWGGTTVGQLGGVYAMLSGGTRFGSRGVADDPGIWIVKSSTSSHIFDGLGVECNAPARIGWDFRRNADMTIAWGAVTQAARSGGFTTLDFTMPAGVAITTMSRTAGIVTVNVASTPQGTTLFDGMQIYVASGSGAFASGIYTVITTVGGIQYAEAGPNVATTPVTGTLSSVGVIYRSPDMYDFIELDSTDAQFPSCQYPVVSSSVTGPATAQIVIVDPYGYGSRSATVTRANIGSLVPQVRFGEPNTVFDEWNNCMLKSLGNNYANEAFPCRPAMDRGSGAAGDWHWVRSGFMNGIDTTVNGTVPLNTLDPDRCAAHLAHGGSTGGVGFIQYETRLLTGNIRVAGSMQGSIYLTVRNVVQNGAIGAAKIRSCLELLGGHFIGQVHNVSNQDDSPPSYGLSVTDRCLLGGLEITSTVKNGGVKSIADSASMAVVWQGRPTTWIGETESPQARREVGNYRNDGYIAGGREDVQSAGGVVQNFGKASQLNEDPNTWPVDGTMSAAVIVGGQSTLGLDGTNAAYKISGATGGGRFVVPIVPSAPLAVDDHVLVGAWVRGDAGGAIPNGDIFTIGDGSGYVTTQWNPASFAGRWMWIKAWCKYTAANVAAGQILFICWFQSTPYVVYRPRLYHFPASQYTAEEVMRIQEVFRPVPNELALGDAGTFPGQKVIAQGGLGVAATILQDPSGAPPPLVKWEPRFGRSGDTTLYAPLFSRPGGLPMGVGIPGQDGEDGEQGPPGVAGLPGATGATGATGASGSAGARGATGEDGEDGEARIIAPSATPIAEVTIPFTIMTTADGTGALAMSNITVSNPSPIPVTSFSETAYYPTQTAVFKYAELSINKFGFGAGGGTLSIYLKINNTTTLITLTYTSVATGQNSAIAVTNSTLPSDRYNLFVDCTGFAAADPIQFTGVLRLYNNP